MLVAPRACQRCRAASRRYGDVARPIENISRSGLPSAFATPIIRRAAITRQLTARRRVTEVMVTTSAINCRFCHARRVAAAGGQRWRRRRRLFCYFHATLASPLYHRCHFDSYFSIAVLPVSFSWPPPDLASSRHFTTTPHFRVAARRDISTRTTPSP